MEFFEITGIFVLCIILLFIGYSIGKYISKKQFEEKIPLLREDAIKQSRAVLSGQFSEQIAPYLPDFPYKPTEARFIGKPIDFVVFKGMDEKKINEVVFLEVKTSQGKLSEVEQTLRDTVKNKIVSWHEYRVTKELTNKK
ncbi:MAG: Holliday junction resolvase-like protein [Nanoarchaeota archaeon]